MPLSTSPVTQSGPFPEGHWRVDPSGSRIAFTVRKLGAGTVRGHFADADGGLVVESGHTSASGSVRVSSIATGDEGRDALLRSPGFFAAEKYLEIAFAAREIVPIDQRSFHIRGDLTIRAQRREIELIASLPTGGGSAYRMQVRGEIDRRDFGLTWNRAIEATGVVAPTIGIELDLEFVSARSLPSTPAACG